MDDVRSLYFRDRSLFALSLFLFCLGREFVLHSLVNFHVQRRPDWPISVDSFYFPADQGISLPRRVRRSVSAKPTSRQF